MQECSFFKIKIFIDFEFEMIASLLLQRPSSIESCGFKDKFSFWQVFVLRENVISLFINSDRNYYPFCLLHYIIKQSPTWTLTYAQF